MRCQFAIRPILERVHRADPKRAVGLLVEGSNAAIEETGGNRIGQDLALAPQGDTPFGANPDATVAGGIDHAGVVVGEAIGSVVGIELCTRTDGLDPEQKACAMALLDRIAWLFRGLGSG